MSIGDHLTRKQERNIDLYLHMIDNVQYYHGDRTVIRGLLLLDRIGDRRGRGMPDQRCISGLFGHFVALGMRNGLVQGARTSRHDVIFGIGHQTVNEVELRFIVRHGGDFHEEFPETP